MPDTPTPFVVIPYFSGDDGTRPVDPQKATWWLCSSILINDVPYSGPLDRSNPLKLSVRVANWGHYPATPLLVRLFWSPPASGPAGVQLHPVGQTIFPVLNAGEEGVIPVIERW